MEWGRGTYAAATMGKTGNPAWGLVVCLFAAAASGQNTPVGKYNGPGGCASSSCHGSIQPRQVTRISQNEYSIWAAQDKHARAYQVFYERVDRDDGDYLIDHTSYLYVVGPDGRFVIAWPSDRRGEEMARDLDGLMGRR